MYVSTLWIHLFSPSGGYINGYQCRGVSSDERLLHRLVMPDVFYTPRPKIFHASLVLSLARARCVKGNGLYPNPADCTKYIKCVNGDSQEKKCPENLKFDSIRHCVLPDDEPDCGKKTLQDPLDEDTKCPMSYGKFPVKSNCHAYMICVDSRPTVAFCSKNRVYSDITGTCVDGETCPSQSEEQPICTRKNQLFPDKRNCRRYIKCVNFEPTVKDCPAGTAYDHSRHSCSKKQLENCKNNDIWNVGQDE